MHDHVRALERRPQGVGVADVTGAVVHLGPPALSRVERPPRDADDLVDLLLVLEQGHQCESEGAGGPGHRHGQSSSSVIGSPYPGRLGLAHVRLVKVYLPVGSLVMS